MKVGLSLFPLLLFLNGALCPSPTDAHETTSGQLEARSPAAGSSDGSEPDPLRISAHREEAILLTQEGRYDEAAERYQSILALDPGDSGARLALARVQSWSGEYEDSVRNYRLLLDSEGSDPSLSLELARVLSWAGHYPESIERYRGHISRYGADGPLRLEYARVLSWSGDYRESSRAYQEYLAGSEDGQAKEERTELARVLAWGGRYPESRAEYLDLTDDYPKDAALCAELGDVYRWAGRFDLARTAYRRSLRIEGSNNRALSGLESIRQDWDRLELSPGYDLWSDSEGFDLRRAAIHSVGHPWEVTTLEAGLESSRLEQSGLAVDALALVTSFDLPLHERLRWKVGYRFVDYDPHGRSDLYTLGLEYRHDLTSTVGLSLSRQDLVTEVFNIRSVTEGIVRSRDLTASYRRDSSTGLSIELTGQHGAQSDGNERVRGGAVLTYMLRRSPYVGISYRFTHLGYRERSNLYWNPARYASHMGLARLAFDHGRTGYEVEAGIGSGSQDGDRTAEYSLSLGGHTDISRGLVLFAGYSRGRTGRLFEDSIYTFSHFNVRLSTRL